MIPKFRMYKAPPTLWLLRSALQASSTTAVGYRYSPPVGPLWPFANSLSSFLRLVVVARRHILVE